MKTKPFLTLTIAAASFFALTLWACSETNAQGTSSKAKAAVTNNPEAAEDVTWDDNGPGPRPFANPPHHEHPEGLPPMDGFRPPRNGDRPGMIPPPMGGPRDGFRNPRPRRPEGPRGERDHGDMLPPPPPPTGPFQDWGQMEKSDPELFKLLKQDHELDRTTRLLTMQYRQTIDEKSKAEIGAQLAETVAKHFDVRQKRRALELERLEKELNRMKALFEKRNTSRDKIIEQRLKELKGEEESLF